MEAVSTSPSPAELAEKAKRNRLRDAGPRRDSRTVFGEQAPAEAVGPAFGQWRDIRIYAQERYNHFAHLLNRGSPLE